MINQNITRRKDSPRRWPGLVTQEGRMLALYYRDRARRQRQRSRDPSAAHAERETMHDTLPARRVLSRIDSVRIQGYSSTRCAEHHRCSLRRARRCCRRQQAGCENAAATRESATASNYKPPPPTATQSLVRGATRYSRSASRSPVTVPAGRAVEPEDKAASCRLPRTVRADGTGDRPREAR